jgi:hypothetical protein
VRTEVGKFQESWWSVEEKDSWTANGFCKKWISSQLKHTKSLVIFGVNVHDLDRDELISVISHLVEQNANLQKTLFYPDYPS